MPNTNPTVQISFGDLKEYLPQEAQNIDLSKWTFNFVRGHEFGEAGQSYIDIKEKIVTSTIPHGLIIDVDNIEQAVNIANFNMVVSNSDSNFIVATNYIFNTLFNNNQRVTCAHYGISGVSLEYYSQQDSNIAQTGHAIAEPIGFQFEWPNETNMNICAELSEYGPKECINEGQQFLCPTYEPDIRDISLIKSEDDTFRVYVRHLRIGLGDLLVQVLVGPEDGTVKAFIFAPSALQQSNLSYLDDIDHVIGEYHYGEDFYEAANNFVHSLIEDAAKSDCGQIIETDLTIQAPKMEYFQYVSIR